MSQPTLLGIPRELRDVILEWVIKLPCTAPAETESLRYQRRHAIPGDKTGAWEATNRVRFQDKPIQNPSLSLLQVNHQIHLETQEMLQRLSTNPPNYILDIVYFKDCSLWPTWLSVPTLTPLVNTVHTQFRIRNCPENLALPIHNQRRGMFRIGCGSPEAIVWVFYHMLAAAIMFGPLGPRRGQPITIRKLVMDFLPTTEPDILPLGPMKVWNGKEIETDYFRFQLPEDWTASQDESLIAAEMLSWFVDSEINRLLDTYYMEQGKILYEQIGEIDIRLAGKPHLRLNLAEKLAKKKLYKGQFVAWREEELMREFLEWKKIVTVKRQEGGLAVEYSSHDNNKDGEYE